MTTILAGETQMGGSEVVSEDLYRKVTPMNWTKTFCTNG